jgi:hypothetical protein
VTDRMRTISRRPREVVEFIFGGVADPGGPASVVAFGAVADIGRAVRA